MLSKVFGGQVSNTDGAILSPGEAHDPPVKQLKCLGKLKYTCDHSLSDLTVATLLKYPQMASPAGGGAADQRERSGSAVDR